MIRKQQLYYSILLILILGGLSSSYSQVISNQRPMLERKLAYPYSTTHLPYISLCFLENAKLPKYNGWLLDDEIKESKAMSLIILIFY